MDLKGKKWLLLIALLAFAGFLANLYFSASFELPVQSDLRTPPAGNQSAFAANQSRPFAPFDPFLRGRLGIPVHSMFLSSALLIAAVVPASYYVLSESLEQKLEMKFNLISKLVKGGSAAPKRERSEGGAHGMEDRDIVLKFLNPSERKVVGALIRKRGEMMQAEISRMDGMNKLRTHRATKDLERKGIIVREGHGKTNRIILADDIKEVLLKSD